MKKMLSILIVVSLMVFSCGEVKESKTNNTKNVEIVINEVEQKEGNTNYFASIEINGMTCAMGCAKTIENKLKTMDGVVAAEVDFDKTIANIEFDQNKTDVNTFIAAITSIHDGQYEVNKATVNKPVANAEPEMEEAEAGNSNTVNSAETIGMNYPIIHIPGILDALFNILID